MKICASSRLSAVGCRLSTVGHPRASLPVIGGLRDSQSRRIEYLRISLTDRCNYRCTYCMPEHGVPLSPKSEVLDFEEIERLVRLLLPLGVRRIRLTGGEPTVRKDLVKLVARLSQLGLDDLAMTSNGERLEELAEPLFSSGLNRLNISLDSLDPRRFLAITRRGDLSAVVRGIDRARAVGFRHTKLNSVVLGGVNDLEIAALCRFAFERDLTPRFIEFMPMSGGALFSSGEFFSAAQIRARIEADFGPLQPGANQPLPGVGPARYHQISTGRFAGKRVGIISAVTEPFCETCNRMRLSAIGRLHTCLAIDDDIDLRTPLRDGESDAEITARIRAAVLAKQNGHNFSKCGSGGPRKHMVAIGG